MGRNVLLYFINNCEEGNCASFSKQIHAIQILVLQNLSYFYFFSEPYAFLHHHFEFIHLQIWSSLRQISSNVFIILSKSLASNIIIYYFLNNHFLILFCCSRMLTRYLPSQKIIIIKREIQSNQYREYRRKKNEAVNVNPLNQFLMPQILWLQSWLQLYIIVNRQYNNMYLYV